MNSPSILPEILGPGAAHHLEPLLDDLSVDGFDLGTPGAGGVGAVMLAHHADRTRLVAAAKPDIEAAAGEMVRHRDVLGEPQRIPVRQHEPHLPLPQPLGVLRQIDVEHQRVGRDVIAFDLEVVLGEHHRGPAGLVGGDRLFAQFVDGGHVTLAIESPETFSKVGFGRDGDRVEHPKFHGRTPLGTVSRSTRLLMIAETL